MNFLKRIAPFKATIALVLFLVAAFAFLSSGELFISIEKIKQLAFNQWVSPQNIFWFWLVHAGFPHLVANALGLLVFGALVEKHLKSRHLLQLFFVSAIGAPLLFTIFFPTIQLVGASGGIAGLIASALVLEPKKSVLALMGLLLLIGGSVTILTMQLDSQQKNLQSQEQQAQLDLNKAIQEKNVEQQQQLEKQLRQLQGKNEQIGETRQFQETIPIENRVHGIGAILGILYLALMTPETTQKQVKKIRNQIHSWLHE
jgi:hypothetical protein